MGEERTPWFDILMGQARWILAYLISCFGCALLMEQRTFAAPLRPSVVHHGEEELPQQQVGLAPGVVHTAALGEVRQLLHTLGGTDT